MLGPKTDKSVSELVDTGVKLAGVEPEASEVAGTGVDVEVKPDDSEVAKSGADDKEERVGSRPLEIEDSLGKSVK